MLRIREETTAAAVREGVQNVPIIDGAQLVDSTLLGCYVSGRTGGVFGAAFSVSRGCSLSKCRLADSAARKMLEIDSHNLWSQPVGSKITNLGRLIRFSHTVFALPFALASVALAWPSHPVTIRSFFWILIAMIGARSAAMAFNRLVDRKFDALNPRTQQWELPQGTVRVWEAVILTLTSSVVFVYAAYQLNFICFILSPVALAIVFFYSLTKRFTWASHLFLGLALSLAPMGAWLAVSGAPVDLLELATPLFLGLAVLFWLAGFDVIYSLQDYAFDRKEGLHSIPVRFGVAAALRFSSFFHICTVAFLAAVGFSAQMGIIYWLGSAIIAIILFWEHRLVTPGDLSRINRAFFDFNAYVSVGYLLTTVADRFLCNGFGIGR